MGLNEIQLPLQTIVDLYKNQLYEDESPNTSSTATPIEKMKVATVENIPVVNISFLGKNLMKLLILVNYSNEVYLPETQLSFIGNILKACKMNIADVAIVNVNQQEVSMAELTRQLSPRYLVIFGIDTPTIQLNHQFTPFNLATINEVQAFISPSLETLNQDNEEGKLLKSKLWLCMKKMLNL